MDEQEPEGRRGTVRLAPEGPSSTASNHSDVLSNALSATSRIALALRLPTHEVALGKRNEYRPVRCWSVSGAVLSEGNVPLHQPRLDRWEFGSPQILFSE